MMLQCTAYTLQHTACRRDGHANPRVPKPPKLQLTLSWQLVRTCCMLLINPSGPLSSYTPDARSLSNKLSLSSGNRTTAQPRGERSIACRVHVCFSPLNLLKSDSRIIQSANFGSLVYRRIQPLLAQHQGPATVRCEQQVVQAYQHLALQKQRFA